MNIELLRGRDRRLSSTQRETATLLAEVFVAVISDRYLDFCRLCENESGLTVVRPMAFHAFRELESLLRGALLPPANSTSQQSDLAPELQKQVRAALKALGFDANASTEALKALRPRTSRSSSIKAILDFLQPPSRDELESRWKALTSDGGRAHERTFYGTLGVNAELLQFRDDAGLLVRELALAAQRRFRRFMKRATDLALETERARAVRQFKAEIPGALPLQWAFFQALESADWLTFLADADLLRDPPLPDFELGANVLMREWPIGQYLLRMASASDAVTRLAVASAVRDVQYSQHLDVRYWVFEILRVLPVVEAMQLLDVGVNWLCDEVGLSATMSTMQLLSKFLDAGAVDASLNLARALFRIEATDGELRSVHGRHLYEHNLGSISPKLVAKCGLPAVELLCDLLELCATAQGILCKEPREDRTATEVADFQQGLRIASEPFSACVVALIRASEAAAQGEANDLAAVAKSLMEREALIFRRLALHAVALHPSAAASAADSLLADPTLFDAYWCQREYSALAKEWMAQAGAQTRELVFAWTRDLPERHLLAWQERFESRNGKPPDADDEIRYREYAIADKACTWKSALPSDLQEAVERSIQRDGDSLSWRHPGITVAAEAAPQPRLFDLTVTEICDLLMAASDPRGDATSTSWAEAELANVANARAVEFSQAAEIVAALPGVYVCEVLEGLGYAANNRQQLDWPGSLTLVRLVLTRASLASSDITWPLVVWKAAALLRAGLRIPAAFSGIDNVDLELVVLEIARLASSEPLPDDFEGASFESVYFASERTLRGAATELCVLFPCWLHANARSRATDSVDGMALAPRVSTALDELLEDTSPTGQIPRTIVGRYLSLLQHCAADWTRQQLTKLLPADPHFESALWVGHLMYDPWCAPAWLPSMRRLFEAEIERLRVEPSERQKSLGRKLLGLYLRGELCGMSDPLLAQFLAKASPQLRLHIIWVLGQDLQLLNPELPEEHFQRGIAYWESRLEVARNAVDAAAFSEELGPIGQWCSSPRLSPDWLITQFAELLRLGIAPTPSYAIFEWLSTVCESRLMSTLSTLELFVSCRAVPIFEFSHAEPALRGIFQCVRASNEPELSSTAHALASILTSRGFTGSLDFDVA